MVTVDFDNRASFSASPVDDVVDDHVMTNDATEVGTKDLSLPSDYLDVATVSKECRYDTAHDCVDV